MRTAISKDTRLGNNNAPSTAAALTALTAIAHNASAALLGRIVRSLAKLFSRSVSSSSLFCNNVNLMLSNNQLHLFSNSHHANEPHDGVGARVARAAASRFASRFSNACAVQVQRDALNII